MSSSDRNGVRLTVTTADAATEIFVLDARFNLVRRGIGRLDETFPAGLYVVRARTGPETREEIVLLPRDAAGPVTATFEPIRYGTPAPLSNTGKTRDDQIAFAKAASSTVQVHAGSGSWLFFFARDWSDEAGRAGSRPVRSPMRGLTLRTPGNETIADLEATAETQSDAPDPGAACSIEVDPGAYRLVLEAGPGLTVEQSVVASPGWQTQVFLLQHDYAGEPEWRRADLVGASILMANGPGFEADHDDQRLADMARLALRDGRRVLSDHLRQMLHDKFSDPMLGIFGAHLLLREQEVDEGLYRIVVNNLQGMLGNHPDVEALALRLRESGSPSFDAPPMLRQSWQLILDATVTRPEIMPADSPLASIAQRVWGEGPWLIWMERSEAELANDLQQIAQSMAMQVGATAGPTERAAGEPEVMVEGAGSAEGDAASDGSDASGGDLSFGSTDETAFEVDIVGGAETGGGSSAYDDATVSRLVQSLGVPRATIEKMLGGS